MGRCYHLPTNHTPTYLPTYLPTSFTRRTVRDGDGAWWSPFGRREASLVREQKQPRLGGKREREMEHGGGANAYKQRENQRKTTALQFGLIRVLVVMVVVVVVLTQR